MRGTDLSSDVRFNILPSMVTVLPSETAAILSKTSPSEAIAGSMPKSPKRNWLGGHACTTGL